METTVALLLNNVRRPSRDSLSGLSVMTVYQDDATQRRASAQCSAVVNGNPLLQRSEWKLSDLSEPGVLAGAVHMAMRADVIVISLTSGAALPLPFYVWVNMWMAYRKVSGGKLILLGKAASQAPFSESAVQYLKQAARQANMLFEAHLLTRTQRHSKTPAHQASGRRTHHAEYAAQPC